MFNRETAMEDTIFEREFLLSELSLCEKERIRYDSWSWSHHRQARFLCT